MRGLCCSAVIVFAAIVASAQDFSRFGKNEIAGTFGHTFISDQAVPNSGLSNPIVSHGAGYTFTVAYARILHSNDWMDLAAEIPATINPDEKLHYATNAIPYSYSSVFITPAARVRFVPDVAFSPWFSFGGGFGYFHASSNLIYFGANTGDRSKTTGVLQFGAGIDVRIPCRALAPLRIRAEFRDHWSDVPPINLDTGKTHQHNYYVGGGLVYRF